MLFSDWAYFITFLVVHWGVVPSVQWLLGAESVPATFTIHWISHLLFHRNINKIACHHYRRKYGVLKEDSPRTKIPASEVLMTKFSGVVGAGLRIAALFLSRSEGRNEPFRLRPTFFFHYFAYVLTLDFVFYWAHRYQHTNRFLFKHVHSKHHRAALPSVLLTVFDSAYEKFFNTFIQMCLVNWIVPMSFWELHCTYLSIHLIEAFGHSGVRAHLHNPLLPFMSWLGVELSVEDHDLHHRVLLGNYGKQTRLWDVVFGTNVPRIETGSAAEAKQAVIESPTPVAPAVLKKPSRDSPVARLKQRSPAPGEGRCGPGMRQEGLVSLGGAQTYKGSHDNWLDLISYWASAAGSGVRGSIGV